MRRMWNLEISSEPLLCSTTLDDSSELGISICKFCFGLLQGLGSSVALPDA